MDWKKRLLQTIVTTLTSTMNKVMTRLIIEAFTTGVEKMTLAKRREYFKGNHKKNTVMQLYLSDSQVNLSYE